MASPTAQIECDYAELEAKGLVEVTLAGRLPVVVGLTDAGELFAMAGRCLHQGARLAAGRLTRILDADGVGRYRLSEDRVVLQCPWHGYEYDVKTGRILSDPKRCVRTFPVRRIGAKVVVST